MNFLRYIALIGVLIVTAVVVYLYFMSMGN